MTKSGNVKIFAWDGTEFREIVIDTSGHPQVDALSVANPPNLDKAISKLIDKSIRCQTTTQTGSVNAGAYEVITFSPPPCKLWRFICLYLYAPGVSGATSGTHEFLLYNPRGTREAMLGRSSYVGPLSFKYSHWWEASALVYPPDEANLGIALSRLIYTNPRPMRLQYINNSNATQTGTRYYELDSLEEYCS